MNKYLARYAFYYPATWLKGEGVVGLLKKARDFQWKSPEQISDYQFQKALSIAVWAKTCSPFYQQHYKDVDLSRIQNLADFSRLPPVTKGDLVAHGQEFVTSYRSKCETKTTGGSTGHPVRVIKNAEALGMERAVTWRAYEWAGVEIADPQGRFWGVPHTRPGRMKAALTDFIANRKRLSAFQLDDQSLGDYYRQLQKFKPGYLYGYVSVIVALADYMRERELPPIKSLKSVITTAEVLYPAARQSIESSFGVKVFNEYGCGEAGSIAHECEEGQLHIMADNLMLEIDGAGEGEILITDFFNFKTPLIRYRVGDFGRLASEPCSCGRGLPVLADVYGRAYDLLRLEGGRSIHPESLIYVLEDFKSESNAILQFQAVQRNHRQVDIFVVPNGGWSEGLAGRLKERMRAKLSAELDYHIQVVSSIARENSGKLRLVKSEVAG